MMWNLLDRSFKKTKGRHSAEGSVRLQRTATQVQTAGDYLEPPGQDFRRETLLHTQVPSSSMISVRRRQNGDTHSKKSTKLCFWRCLFYKNTDYTDRTKAKCLIFFLKIVKKESQLPFLFEWTQSKSLCIITVIYSSPNTSEGKVRRLFDGNWYFGSYLVIIFMPVMWGS